MLSAVGKLTDLASRFETLTQQDGNDAPAYYNAAISHADASA